jgi:hypothetical protein
MKTEVAEKNVETQQAYPKGRWTLNANPFNTTRRVPASPVQSGPVTAQGELSLDRVRPVRNDLSDSDLELIPARQVQENVFAAPTAAPAAVKKQTFWARLRARFRRNPAK